MIEEKQIENKKVNLMQIFQPPSLYKRRPKVVHKQYDSILKGLNNRDFVDKSHRSDQPIQKNKNSRSSPQTSIEQIKGKIKEYLHNRSETSGLNNYGSQVISPLTYKNSSYSQQYRISIFRNNAKRKINLQMLEEVNPQKSLKIARDFISEAQINSKTTEDQHSTQTQHFLRRKHRNKITDLKYLYQRRNLSLPKREKLIPIDPEKKVSGKLRQSTPREWQLVVDPWGSEDQLIDFSV